MSTLLHVIFYSLIGGVFSLIGGVLLLSNKNRAKSLAKYATPFAAGALLAAAFSDLLKEAAHTGNIETALTFALVGILMFFILERFLHWFHHHKEDSSSSHIDHRASLVIIGDTLHNFIDGIAIAAGFLVSPATGIIVTLAVAAHEIPQEIGDFGLLLSKGMSRKKVILVNVLSALATTLAAVIFFTIGQSAELPIDALLGVIAGFFIYIATSDIIPSIHKNEENKVAGPQTFLLIAGAIFVSLVTTYLHRYIDAGHEDHTHEESHEHSHSDSKESIYNYSDHDTLPSVDLSATQEDGAWMLNLKTANFKFSKDAVDKDHVDGEGHAHLYVNDKKIARIYSETYELKDVKAGDKIKVTLNTNDHREYAHHDKVIHDEVTLSTNEHDEHHHDDHDDEKSSQHSHSH